MWSQVYEQCQSCGTRTVKHKGKGLCRTCWHKDWVRSNPERRKEHKQREYLRNKERYQASQKRYAEKNKEGLKEYWQAWHRKKSFGGKYEEVLHRDNGKCVLCGNKKSIIVHHIDEDRSNNVVENLVTLCRRCHPKVHYSKQKVKIQSELHRNMQS